MLSWSAFPLYDRRVKVRADNCTDGPSAAPFFQFLLFLSHTPHSLLFLSFPSFPLSLTVSQFSLVRFFPLSSIVSLFISLFLLYSHCSSDMSFHVLYMFSSFSPSSYFSFSFFSDIFPHRYLTHSSTHIPTRAHIKRRKGAREKLIH